jgi:acetoin utilization deacetylase AcuC-like enzyme
VDAAWDAHAPDLVLLSCGFDAAKGDQEGFRVTPACYGEMVARLCCRAGPSAAAVVAVLEGGYQPRLVREGAACVMRALKSH